MAEMNEPIRRRRAFLTWQGGTVQSPHLAGFRVYGASSAGGPVDYAKPLATISARPGEELGEYSWNTPEELDIGSWEFAVVSFDVAGNEGAATTVVATVEDVPGEPAPFPDGSKLKYMVNPHGEGATTGPTVTLTWNPPSDQPRVDVNPDLAPPQEHSSLPRAIPATLPLPESMLNPPAAAGSPRPEDVYPPAAKSGKTQAE